MRAFLAAVVVIVGAAGAAQAEPLTKVFINGVATPVYLNDGDSFRPQAGPLKGQQSRLSGYNTLESFGPAHQWGHFKTKDLYTNAKQATLEARRGVWHCETDGKKDGYGRLLIFCKDLAKDLISKGLAHAYSADASTGDKDLLEAQRTAMKDRVGMWAHGVPRFVMTSIHSKSEGGDKDGKNYNRLISTFDAHTEKWEHNDTYAECQKVCEEVPMPTPEDVVTNVGLLQSELAGVAEADQQALVKNVIDLVYRSPLVTSADYEVFEGKLPAGADAAKIDALLAAVKKLQGDQKLAVNGKESDSCFTYVDFRRRYGGDRAACLR